MLDITKDNQTELIYYKATSNEVLNELQSRYDWNNYNEYDNLQTELSSLFFDPLAAIAHRNNVNEAGLFKGLTKSQKVIYTLNAFHGQINNGGIYQFFWNIPEFTLAVEQSITEIDYPELLEKYKKVVQEFNAKEAEMNKLKWKSALNGLKYQIKQAFLKLTGKHEQGLRTTGFDDFVLGKTLMKNTEWFNEYFGEIEKMFYQKQASYILTNINTIVLISK